MLTQASQLTKYTFFYLLINSFSCDIAALYVLHSVSFSVCFSVTKGWVEMFNKCLTNVQQNGTKLISEKWDIENIWIKKWDLEKFSIFCFVFQIVFSLILIVFFFLLFYCCVGHTLIGIGLENFQKKIIYIFIVQFVWEHDQYDL